MPDRTPERRPCGKPFTVLEAPPRITFQVMELVITLNHRGEIPLRELPVAERSRISLLQYGWLHRRWQPAHEQPPRPKVKARWMYRLTGAPFTHVTREEWVEAWLQADGDLNNAAYTVRLLVKQRTDPDAEPTRAVFRQVVPLAPGQWYVWSPLPERGPLPVQVVAVDADGPRAPGVAELPCVEVCDLISGDSYRPQQARFLAKARLVQRQPHRLPIRKKRKRPTPVPAGEGGHI